MWRSFSTSKPHTRKFALVTGIGICIGGSLPEFGNVATKFLDVKQSHYFNQYFLVASLCGILISLFALCRRSDN
jgi:hypothetical protein